MKSTASYVPVCLADHKLRNISQATWVEMRKRPILFNSLITFATVVSVLLLAFSELVGDLVELALWVWVPLLVWYVATATTIRTKFWREVATRLGWQYVGYRSVSDEEALFLNTGHTRSMYNVIIGTHDDIPVRIFESRYSVGSGRHKSTITFSGFSFRYQGEFPHLYLNRKDDDVNFISSAKYRVSLPGAFDKDFALYAPKEYEIEALQIFTPDVLEYLLGVDWLHDIEFVDHELFILRRGYINSLDTFELELENAIAVARMFKTSLNRMRFLPIPNTPHLLRDMPGKMGAISKAKTTLKTTGPWWWQILVWTVFVVFVVNVFLAIYVIVLQSH